MQTLKKAFHNIVYSPAFWIITTVVVILNLNSGVFTLWMLPFLFLIIVSIEWADVANAWWAFIVIAVSCLGYAAIDAWSRDILGILVWFGFACWFAYHANRMYVARKAQVQDGS